MQQTGERATEAGTGGGIANWWRSSPGLEPRTVAMAATVALVAAAVSFLPVLAGVGTRIPLDLGDPLPQAWQVSWGGHALLHQPLAFWQANQFWPLADTLAFSDALVGYAPFGMIGSGTKAAVARYDLLFIFAFAMAAFSTWLLSRELGCPAWAAAAAGAAFAFSPWRLEQGGHLHVISSGGIPLAFFLLLRGLRRESPWLIVSGFAAAAWQVSIGFTLGIQLIYLMAAFAAVVGIGWWQAGRPTITGRLKAGIVGGAVLFAGACIVLVRPYLRVQETYDSASRTIGVVRSFSPGPKAFLTAPETNLTWGGATGSLRDWAVFGMSEKILFPGLIVIALSLAGLMWSGAPRALRIGIAAVAAVAASLSLGIHTGLVGSHLPYRWLWELAPGWRGARTPGRIHTTTTLALALLTGFGAAAAIGLLKRSGRTGFAALAAPLIALLIVVEGSSGDYPTPNAPKAPVGLAGLAEPVLQLPATPWDNRRYVLWSTDGFPEMLNGRSSLDPPFFTNVIRRTKGFPDAESIAFLRSIGVQTVVVHTAEPARARAERLESTSPSRYRASLKMRSTARAIGRDARPTWAEATAKRLPAGSGVTRTLRRPLVIYRLAG